MILVADPQQSSLIDFRFKHHFRAGRAGHGQGARRHGADGADLVLKVPLGTVVRELDAVTMEPLRQLADLTYPGQRVVVAPGGHGGRGNARFVTSTRRAPAFAERGEPALEHWIELEMKLMADVALVGMPSVGKSSLIARLSAARPKIAEYPFTTLVPNLGVVRARDGSSFVAADVPGLIEGASEGKGLGHEFLRHIERTALIAHVVDVTGGFEARDPVGDYHAINDELSAYAEELASRPQFVVANKCDVEGCEDALRRLEAAAEADGRRFFAVSALTGEGLDSFRDACATEVAHLRAASEPQAKDVAAAQAQNERAERSRAAEERRIVVGLDDDGALRLSGTALERMVVQTDWDNDEAVAYLQQRLEHLGIGRVLSEAGAHEGDEVRILGYAFEYHGDDESESLDEGVSESLGEKQAADSFGGES